MTDWGLIIFNSYFLPHVKPFVYLCQNFWIMKTSKFSILLFIAFIFPFQFGWAQDYNISLDEARNVAAYRMAIAHGTSKYNVDDARLVYTIKNPLSGHPTAYFFNVNDNGFIIVSGHRASLPIIGYSEVDTLHVDNMAPAMLWWVENFCEEVADAQNEQWEPSDEAIKAWQELEDHYLTPESAKAANWLLDSKWDQGENYNPTYNLYCPVYYHKSCYTGCVATALGQIMRYFEFPHVGKLSKSYYQTYTIDGQDGIITSPTSTIINYAQTYYNYDLMPDQLSTQSDSAEIKEVAKLLFHVGIAIDASYGTEGTSAVSEYVSAPLRRYFKYKSSANVYRSGYEDQKWEDTLIHFIRMGVPIYYSAASSSSSDDRDGAGHAFICHGAHSDVASNHLFRFNWGWSGYQDGWYTVSNLNPRTGSGLNRYNFELRQAAILGLMPPDDSSSVVVGINPVASAELATAYPNPASYKVVIPYTTQPDAHAVLQVLDVTGRLMESRQLVAGQGEVHINVTSYPKGIYFYRVQDGAMHKFIVQ